MSVNARKDCRTQGKYSDRSQYYDDKRPQRQDKRLKGSSTVKVPQEKKFHKRMSDGGKASNTSLGSESDSPVRYEENSVHTFSQLEEGKKPIEIKNPGKYSLSDTENGESVVFYEPYLFEECDADERMKRLQNTTSWYNKNIIIHGVEYPQPRLVAWYGPFPYTYSGATLEPAEMPDCVLEIKKKVEEYLRKNGINVILNSVLLNLYRHNKDSVAWHSDDEMSMGVCPTIASVSLGETRKFEMRRKLKQPLDESTSDKYDEYFVNLTSGSLLIMDGCMQKDWQHRVPKEYHDKHERINLTFRTVYKLEDLPPSPGACAKNQFADNVVKKSPESKTDYGVSYEDFPPLNTDASPASSRSDKKSPESSTSIGMKTSNEMDESHKIRDNVSPPGNKTLSQNNNGIAEPDEMWDIEPSFCNETSLKIDDKIPRSDRVRDNKHTYNKTSFKNRNKVLESDDLRDIEPQPYHKPSLENDKIYKSDKIRDYKRTYNKTSMKNRNKSAEDDMWGTEPSPCYTTSLKTNHKVRNSERTHNKTSMKSRNKITEEDTWDTEPSPCYTTSLETNDKVQDYDRTRNKTFSKNRSKIAESDDMWDTNPSSCYKTSLENDKIYRSDKIRNNKRTHIKTSFKSKNEITESGGIWDTEPPPCYETPLKSDDKTVSEEMCNSDLCIDTFSKTHAKINRSEKQTFESANDKKSTVLNNLNEDRKNLKIDMQKKNLDQDSNFSSNNNVSAATNARKNKNLISKENHNITTNSPDNNMQGSAHQVKNEPASNIDSSWTPNVEAKEFVPVLKSSICADNPYSPFHLENLLNYSVDVMDFGSLTDFAFALKRRVLEKVHEFSLSNQEELEVLCALTDGDQTEKNLKLITSRISTIVARALHYPASQYFRKSYGSSRKINHGNQNHFSERKYHGGSKEIHHRH